MLIVWKPPVLLVFQNTNIYDEIYCFSFMMLQEIYLEDDVILAFEDQIRSLMMCLYSLYVGLGFAASYFDSHDYGNRKCKASWPVFKNGESKGLV